MKPIFLPFALLGLLALANCGGRGAPPAPTPEGTVTRPAFSDADPTDWPGRGPAAFQVHGVDAARFQGDVDWARARANGVNFAFVKATEGGDRVDERFKEYWGAAGRAGIARGAYHFFYFCTPAAVQARWFIENVPRTPGALPPVLDLEWNHLSPTCTLRPDPAIVRREARIFLDIVGRHYGQRPIVYTTPEFWERNGIAQLGGEIWLRSVARPVSEVYPGAPWIFWQYSGTGLVPGFPGKVDLNAFSGSPAAWTAWRARRTQR